jgi:outer membrane protein TolC
MSQHHTALAAVAALMLAFCFQAQGEDLSLEQALTAAQHYSAELSANQHQRIALDNMADSAMQLPDPKLEAGIENLPLQGSNSGRFTREGMTMEKVGIMQTYVSQEKRERKAQALQAQARKTAADSVTLATQLQRDTAQAWLDLALTQQGVVRVAQLVAESEKQLPVQHASIASGSAPVSSLLDARLTLVAMQDQLTNAQRDVAVAQARLAQLTGIRVDRIQGHLPRIERLPADEQLLKQAVLQHPELIAAQREADVAQAKARQSAVAARPDVGVEVYYGRRSSGNEDLGGVMFTVDLPVMQSQRQDKDHAADLAQAMQANDNLTQQIRVHKAQLDSLLAQYQAALTRWQRQQQQVVPLQQQRLTLLQAQYRSGQSSLNDVLQGRLALLNSQLDTINAQREMAQVWAAIRYLTPQEALQ